MERLKGSAKTLYTTSSGIARSGAARTPREAQPETIDRDCASLRAREKRLLPGLSAAREFPLPVLRTQATPGGEQYPLQLPPPPPKERNGGLRTRESNQRGALTTAGIHPCCLAPANNPLPLLCVIAVLPCLLATMRRAGAGVPALGKNFANLRAAMAAAEISRRTFDPRAYRQRRGHLCVPTATADSNGRVSLTGSKDDTVQVPVLLAPQPRSLGLAKRQQGTHSPLSSPPSHPQLATASSLPTSPPHVLLTEPCGAQDDYWAENAIPSYLYSAHSQCGTFDDWLRDAAFATASARIPFHPFFLLQYPPPCTPASRLPLMLDQALLSRPMENPWT